MSASYQTPVYFVTIKGNPASQAVITQLRASLDLLASDSKGDYSLIIQNTPDLLLESFSKIPVSLTVALFDVPAGIKCYKPLHLTQFNAHRPLWANRPLWSVAINTHRANDRKVIRNCTQSIAAWFRTGIKQAIPGHSYPWGPVPVNERTITIQRLAQTRLP